MKKIKIFIAFIMIIGFMALLQSCGSKRDPGRIYMPDMAYSRAYEAYAPTPNSFGPENINFIPYPVEGTIRRGDLFPYPLPNDTVGYNMSAQVKDPLSPNTPEQMKEAERLFNINCGICHGAKMDAQGPLATGGKVPAIANLTLAQYVAMPEGTMFHSVTYGKNNMGSYASQLTREQRWRVIQYVKAVQGGKMSTMAPSDSTGKATSDSTAAKGNDSTKTK